MIVSDRRDLIRAISSATLVGTAGCSEVPSSDGEPDDGSSDDSTEEEPLVFRASSVGIGEGRLVEAGYSLERRGSFGITRTVNVGDRSYDIEALNRLAEYERTVVQEPFERRPAARFAVVSSPRIEIAGEEFNLISTVSDERLAEEMQSGYSELTLGEGSASGTVMPFGRSVEATRRRGVATFRSREIDIFVHSARTRHDGDFVVMVGVYPQSIDEPERSKTLGLMDAVVHGDR